MTSSHTTRCTALLLGLIVGGSGLGCTELAGPVDDWTDDSMYQTAAAAQLFAEADASGLDRPFTMVGPAAPVMIYKDFNAWNFENRDEVTLQSPPFNMVPGVDYAVRTTAELSMGIPSIAHTVFITSNSKGALTTVNNVNSPAAQEALDEFVQSGGTLVVHMADALPEAYGFRAPGMTGPAANDGDGNPLFLALSDHPIVRGPDGELGTEDDLTDSGLTIPPLGCCAHHGSFSNRTIPGDATVLVTGENERPVHALYSHGAGNVLVSTITLEWGVDGLFGHRNELLVNHFWTAFNPPEVPKDSDGDGVLDSDDMCPDTVLPEDNAAVAYLRFTRYAMLDDGDTFATVNTDPNPPVFTLADTAGCSCSQIIENLDHGYDEVCYGCLLETMETWVELVNP